MVLKSSLTINVILVFDNTTNCSFFTAQNLPDGLLVPPWGWGGNYWLMMAENARCTLRGELQESLFHSRRRILEISWECSSLNKMQTDSIAGTVCPVCWEEKCRQERLNLNTQTRTEGGGWGYKVWKAALSWPPSLRPSTPPCPRGRVSNQLLDPNKH